eukprot:jgi/Mesen1/153/ME1130913C07596
MVQEEAEEERAKKGGKEEETRGGILTGMRRLRSRGRGSSTCMRLLCLLTRPNPQEGMERQGLQASWQLTMQVLVIAVARWQPRLQPCRGSWSSKEPSEPEMKEQEERDDTPFSIVANSEPAAPQGLGVSEGVQMTETTFQGDQAPFDDMPPAPEGGGPRDGEGNEGSGDLARETDEFVDAEAQFADDEDLEAQYSHAAAGVAGDPSKPDVGDEHLDHAAFGGMEMAGDGTYGSFVPDSADL